VRPGRFRTNSPPVVHETVDHETIVVNLDTGSYYDLNESGGYIFGLLQLGSALPELAQRTAARYGIDQKDAETAVDDLVAKLVAEQLVVTAEGEPTRNAPSPDAGNVRPYAAPVINKYTDMQELLLLDPVHEVDEAGWPSRT
jgi:hypothetical protein